MPFAAYFHRLINPREPPALHHRALLLIAAWVIGFFIAVIFTTNIAHAQEINVGLEQTGAALGLPATDIRIVVANVIRIALGLLGIIVVGIIIYAGFLYMTAGGNEEQATKARQWLTNGVIGLAIILAAFAIVSFVMSRLLQGVVGGAGGFGPGGVPAGTPFSGALGNGIIRDHYPGRGARDVPRNTMIGVTFKEAVSPASVIQDTNGNGTIGDAGDLVNPQTIKIIRSRDIDPRGIGFTSARLFVTAVAAGATPDHTSFVFKPHEPLGSPTEPMGYAVALIGGNDGVKKENGSAAFPGGLGAPGYQWDFEIGTTLDLVPPRVERIVPSSGEWARNIVPEVWFNEPINPVSAAGAVPPFLNLGITATPPGNKPPGEFKIGNGYRTVEFVSSDSCGVNSCGANTYCLPARAAIGVTVFAATLTPAADDGAQAALPFDGVVDMAGNSLDGDRDGRAEGPGADSVSAAFGTSADVDRTPPTLEAISPGIDEGNVALDVPLTATFHKIMRSGTLSSDNMSLRVEPDYEAWFAIRAENLDAEGRVASSTPPVRTRATWSHPLLRASEAGVRYDYLPGMTSGVQDQYQNCFFPGVGPGAGGAACGATPDRPYCCNGTPQAAKCGALP